MQSLRCQNIRRMKSVLVLLLLASFSSTSLAAERVDVGIEGLSRAQVCPAVLQKRYRAGIQPETTTNLLPIGATARVSEVEDTLFPQRG